MDKTYLSDTCKNVANGKERTMQKQYMDAIRQFEGYQKYIEKREHPIVFSCGYGDTVNRFLDAGNRIDRILTEYDNTGQIAVIYAKRHFESFIQETMVKM